MKGTTIIFEQVLLFMISVSIFTVCFFFFSLYQTHFTSVAVNDQVKAVRDMISSHVLELTSLREMNATSEVKVPKTISSEFYSVAFAGTVLNVTTLSSRISATMDLKGIARDFRLYGNSTSSKGEIIIYKRGNNIILG
jgi:hypothetical protein